MTLTNQILIDYPFNFQKQKVIIINRLKYIDKVSTLIILPKNTPNAKQFNYNSNDPILFISVYRYYNYNYNDPLLFIFFNNHDVQNFRM